MGPSPYPSCLLGENSEGRIFTRKRLIPRYKLLVISIATGHRFSDKKRVLANVSAEGV